MTESRFPPAGDYDGCPHCAFALKYTLPAYNPVAGWRTGPGVETYNRKILVEIRGVYDCGQFYQCPSCDKTWHRWTPTDNARLWTRAEEIMSDWADKRLRRELEDSDC